MVIDSQIMGIFSNALSGLDIFIGCIDSINHFNGIDSRSINDCGMIFIDIGVGSRWNKSVVEVIERINSLSGIPFCVVMTDHCSHDEIVKFIDAGASLVLSKNDDADKIRNLVIYVLDSYNIAN